MSGIVQIFAITKMSAFTLQSIIKDHFNVSTMMRAQLNRILSVLVVNRYCEKLMLCYKDVHDLIFLMKRRRHEPASPSQVEQVA